MTDMKRAVGIAILVFIVTALPAYAILRPRYPARPTPPFTGQVIIIGEDVIKKEIQPPTRAK